MLSKILWYSKKQLGSLEFFSALSCWADYKGWKKFHLCPKLLALWKNPDARRKFLFFFFHWMSDKMWGRLGIFILPNNFGYKGGKVGKVPFLPKFSCKMERWLKVFYASQKLKAISKKNPDKNVSKVSESFGQIGKVLLRLPNNFPQHLQPFQVPSHMKKRVYCWEQHFEALGNMRE